MFLKRVVFLDIDGVFNCVGSMLAFHSVTAFDEIAIRLVARLCRLAGADIVISSSWRIGKDLKEVQGIFRRRGAVDLSKRVISMTPRLSGLRGEEIARWLLLNGSREYIIIDDDSDMLPEQVARFVQTSSLTGFRLPEYVAALALFEPEHEDLKCVRGYRVRTLEWPEEKTT